MVWRKMDTQSLTLDQAGDWTRDLLVGSQRSYLLFSVTCGRLKTPGDAREPNAKPAIRSGPWRLFHVGRVDSRAGRGGWEEGGGGGGRGESVAGRLRLKAKPAEPLFALSKYGRRGKYNITGKGKNNCVQCRKENLITVKSCPRKLCFRKSKLRGGCQFDKFI